MARLKRGPRLTTVLLIAAAITIIVQNLFLVLKVSRQRETIKSLNATIELLTQVQVGDTLNGFQVMTADSNLSYLSTKKTAGSYTLLLVFTTWCEACEHNMEHWNRLVRELPQTKLTVVGLTPDSLYKIRDYMQRVPVAFPVVSTAHNVSIMKKYKLLSYPKTLLVDTAGVVKNMWRGILTHESRKMILDSLKRAF